MSSDEETLTTVVEQVEKQRNKRKDKLSKKKKHRKAVDSDNEQHFDISELMERIDAFVQIQNEHNALIKSLTDDSKEQTKLIMSLTEKSNEQNDLIKQLTDGSTESKKKSKKKSSYQMKIKPRKHVSHSLRTLGLCFNHPINRKSMIFWKKIRMMKCLKVLLMDVNVGN